MLNSSHIEEGNKLVKIELTEVERTEIIAKIDKEIDVEIIGATVDLGEADVTEET